MPIPNFETLLENVLDGEKKALSQWLRYTSLKKFDEEEINSTLQKINALLEVEADSSKKGNTLYLKALWKHYGVGYQKDYVEANKLYKKARTLGNDNAMNDLAYMYYHGLGVEKDYAQAKLLYEEASKLGNASAMNNLAYLYSYGLGVEKDYAQAKLLYEKAMALENASAMNNLGMMYEKGLGVEKDYAQAKLLYEKAKALGSATAMNNLGMMYEKGLGVEKNYGIAKFLYKEASELGNAASMYNLARMYEEGLGIKKNYTKALMLKKKYVELTEEALDLRSLYEKVIPELKEKNRELNNVYIHIDRMLGYGKDISSNSGKGQLVIDHAKALQDKLDKFLIDTCQNSSNLKEKEFKEEFIQFLHSKDEAMAVHREVWKPIVINIAIAFTGVGLVALITKILAHSIDTWANKKDFSWNKAVFFAKTHSQILAEEIDNAALAFLSNRCDKK